MCKQTNSTLLREGKFNTLGYSETFAFQFGSDKPIAIIAGRGSQLGDTGVLRGRAKRKMVGQALSLGLMDVAKKKENENMIKALWNTFHCQGHLITVGDRYYGRYCKNRFCPLCCSIRKATIINNYYPELTTWRSPMFLTLTVKSVKKHRLRELMRKMIERFAKIVAKYRKRHLRNGTIKLLGIRSLECNFNPEKKTYNPHFHLIVANEETANILRAEWLNVWKYPWTTERAQHSRPVENLERDLIETIKYGSKILPDPDCKSKREKIKGRKNVYALAQYNIYEAMKGLRIFERFGFNLERHQDIKPVGQRAVTEFNEWKYLAEFFDWHHTKNELTLIGYCPTPQLLDLLRNNIDCQME